MHEQVTQRGEGHQPPSGHCDITVTSDQHLLVILYKLTSDLPVHVWIFLKKKEIPFVKSHIKLVGSCRIHSHSLS